jgi:hypothetical protein
MNKAFRYQTNYGDDIETDERLTFDDLNERLSVIHGVPKTRIALRVKKGSQYIKLNK